MLGKIIDGQLILAGTSIKTDLGTITNPTDNILRELGYKDINYNENQKPNYDFNTQRLKEVYVETDIINVCYEIVELTEEEILEIKKQKVICLEQQYNMCRWQREIILSENSGASDYTKTKAQEIEDLAEGLR